MRDKFYYNFYYFTKILINTISSGPSIGWFDKKFNKINDSIVYIFCLLIVFLFRLI